MYNEGIIFYFHKYKQNILFLMCKIELFFILFNEWKLIEGKWLGKHKIWLGELDNGIQSVFNTSLIISINGLKDRNHSKFNMYSFKKLPRIQHLWTLQYAWLLRVKARRENHNFPFRENVMAAFFKWQSAWYADIYNGCYSLSVTEFPRAK